MLKSERLQYTRFTPEEFPAYFQMARDPEMMIYIAGKPLTEAEAQQRYQKGLNLHQAHPVAGIYAVRIKGGDEIIGLGKIEMGRKGAPEVGYMVQKSHWGKGYGKEIAAYLVESLKARNEFPRLTAVVDPRNEGSIAILTQLGFKHYLTEPWEDTYAAWYELWV